MKTLIALLLLATSLAAQAQALAWQPFTPALFQQAARENKPVFLYLEAVWCHWCHVMQKKTFPDPAVQAALAKGWLVTRVDHDANPLVANRYRDYGWPALIFFNAQGQEVVKRAGFMAPEDFTRLLAAIEADPTPEPGSLPTAQPTTGVAKLSPRVKKTLQARHQSAYDPVHGSLKLPQKYLDRDSVEYALALAASGNRSEARRVRQTLDAASALIDPVWGGIYQYSTHGDWAHAHFEKIMRSQGKSLALYALAYGQLKNPQDLRRAEAIRDYLLSFLSSPEGAFYVSQDADVVPGEKSAAYFALPDAQRRAIGIPRVDTNRYAQENGLAIEALATLARTARDTRAQAAAITAARWVLKHRANADGSFRHGEADEGRYLGDSLHMARGFLALHAATGSAEWLAAAQRTAEAMNTLFAGEGSGFLTGSALGATVEPPRTVEENIAVARFYTALAKASGEARWLKAADHALAWLYQPEVALELLTEPGILLAAQERAAQP